MKYQSKQPFTRQGTRRSIELIVRFCWSSMLDWASHCRQPAIIAGRLAASRNIYLRQELCAIAEEIQAKYQDRVPVLDLLAITAYEQVFLRQVGDSCPVVNRSASLSSWAHSTRCHQVRTWILWTEQRQTSSSSTEELADLCFLINSCSKRRNLGTDSVQSMQSHRTRVKARRYQPVRQLSFHPTDCRTKQPARRAHPLTQPVLVQRQIFRVGNHQRLSFVVPRRVLFDRTAVISLRRSHRSTQTIYHPTNRKHVKSEDIENKDRSSKMSTSLVELLSSSTENWSDWFGGE